MVAKLHNSINADEGKLDIVINRQSIFDDSINFISNLDAETLTRRLFVKFINEPVRIRLGSYYIKVYLLSVLGS